MPPGRTPRTTAAKLGPLLLAAAFGSLAAWLFRGPLSDILFREAAQRQADYVCRVLKEGRVSLTQICSGPLSQAAELEPHYRELREQDGEWYAEHGYDLYPTVDCSGDLQITALNQPFRCDGARAVRP